MSYVMYIHLILIQITLLAYDTLVIKLTVVFLLESRLFYSVVMLYIDKCTTLFASIVVSRAFVTVFINFVTVLCNVKFWTEKCPFTNLFAPRLSTVREKEGLTNKMELNKKEDDVPKDMC